MVAQAPPCKFETKHGKGRVKLRASQAERGELEPPLRLAAVAHCDSEHGEREGDPAPRFSKSLVEGWLERYQINTSAKEYRVREELRTGRPVHIADCELLQQVANVWSLDYLSDQLAGCSQALEVLCSDAKVNRFMEADESKNIYGNQYHVREPETRKLRMKFTEFAECLHLWKDDTVFLSEVIASGSANADDKAGSTTRDSLQPSEITSGDFAEEIKEKVNWNWLDNLKEVAKLGEFSSMNLMVMGQNSLLPLKYDTQDRILCQVRGRLRCLLVSPEYAMHGLYPFPVHHAYDKFSMIDTENVDSVLWPHAHEVEGFQCILQPGDALFVPQYWMLAVQSLEPECISLDVHLGFRWRSADAAELQVSRAIEFRVADLEGIEDVKHWLGIIARDEELDWIDLGTLRGYRRITLVQMIHDEIAECLGSRAYSGFLMAMCESRLNPTTWLNKNFREPLYLLDKPVWREDNRTEEEKKYPQFFRKNLEEKGWTVPKTESTLKIPGYNTAE